MSVAYVDSSVIIALIFGEAASPGLRKLQRFEQLVSSNLLEAEVRGACARERVDFSDDVLAGISWIIPDRPLSAELGRVLENGYVRGPDCWHLANALYLSTNPADLDFITLDKKQAAAARSLGFRL